ncbi:MAG: aminotransferase class V-fold PLP-dependent enzyme [Candidatus Eremiobacteraeota bacterium]|nr:aminotransferase class V-fold PLP-dependent enzyme [Candidatus Eremiobacteraeota bacterium]
MNPPLDRALFDVTGHYTYLNHAAVGVLPVPARDAVQKLAAAQASGGVMGVWQTEARLPEFRATVARFIGADAHEIALLRNTSEGANVIASGIDWQAGDEIITNDNEFPSNAYPWLACRDRGAVVTFVDTKRERLTPDVLRRMICKRTRVVAVSWVGFDDGYRHDLAALAEVAHREGALFCVDVIQALGAFPLDVRACNIDAAYGGGQKWLMALQGVGFLYVAQHVSDRLRLAAPGWRSAADIWDFLDYDQGFATDAARFEGGTPNIAGALSMAESIAVLQTAGDAIAPHVLALTDRLCEGLLRLDARISSERGPQVSSGIVTFTIPGCDSIALGKILQRERIVTTYRSNGVRVSPHGYNRLEDIDHLLEITAAAVPSLVSP